MIKKEIILRRRELLYRIHIFYMNGPVFVFESTYIIKFPSYQDSVNNLHYTLKTQNGKINTRLFQF